MRTTLFLVFVTIGGLAGFIVLRTAPPVYAQASRSNWLPFSSGETLSLYVDLPENLVACKVTQVQNGFIGCAADERSRSVERWINLRYVKDIRRR